MANKSSKLLKKVIALVCVISLGMPGMNNCQVKAESLNNQLASREQTETHIYDTEIYTTDDYKNTYEYTGKAINITGIKARAVSGEACVLQDIEVSNSYFTYYTSDDAKIEQAPTDVGTYKIVAELIAGKKQNVNQEELHYKGCTSPPFRFEITQAENQITDFVCNDIMYDGETSLSPSAKADFGQIVYTYSTEENGEYTETPPVNAGTYYVKASVAETNNYKGADSEPKKVTINRAKYPAIDVSGSAVTVNDETISGKGDGSVTIDADKLGVRDAVIEYKAESAGDADWTDIPLNNNAYEVQELGAGNYLIRYKEDRNHESGEEVRISIEKGRTLFLELLMGDNTTLKFDKFSYNQEIRFNEMENYHIPGKKGYTFQRWRDKESDKTYIDMIQSIMGDMTLHAEFEPNEYNVTYDANGGNENSVPAADTATYDAVYTISETKPSRTGYTFLGWSTDAAATEPMYTEEQNKNTFTYNEKAEDTILYAVWSANTYNVTYDANGGEASSVPEADTATYDAVYTISEIKPSRIGYTFLGWSTDAAATEPMYTEEQNKNTFTYNKKAEDTILYAVWSANTYNVTYDVNKGDAATAPKADTATYDAVYKVSDKKPSRTGYTFTGWSTDANATEPMYTEEQDKNTFTYNEKAEDTILYAVWSANTYNVTYDVNKGDTATAPKADTATYDAEYKVSNKKPSRTGYTFTGWSTDAAATGPMYTEEHNTFTYNEKAEDTTLYAVWSANTYNVTYDVNKGDSATTPKADTATYDAEYTVSGTKPTRTGYTFLGWSTDSKATEPAYKAENNNKFAYKTDGHTKFYAVWKANEYNVTYDVNGGDEASEPKTDTAIYDAVYTINDTKPTKTGYTFMGWSTDSETKEPAYTEEKNTFTYNEKAEDTTLYAVWSANTYNVTYNLNGGNDVPSDKAVYDSEYIIAGAPDRTGYEFVAWQNGSENYVGGQKITPFRKIADLVLQAVWKMRDVDSLTYTQPSNRQINLVWTASNPAPGQTYEITMDGVTVASNLAATSYTIDALSAGSHNVKVAAVNGTVRSTGKSITFSVKTTLSIKVNGKVHDYELGYEPSYRLPVTHKEFVNKYPELVMEGYIFDGFMCNGKVIDSITNHTEVTVKWRSIATKLNKIKTSKGKITFKFNKADWENISGYKISYSLDSKMKKKVKTINVKGKKKTYVFKNAKKKLKNGGIYYFHVKFYYKNKAGKTVYYKGSSMKKWIRYYKK